MYFFVNSRPWSTGILYVLREKNRSWGASQKAASRSVNIDVQYVGQRHGTFRDADQRTERTERHGTFRDALSSLLPLRGPAPIVH